MALSPEGIVGAALGILDEFGLADLSMRRVAGALDVKAGALYWHFPNKQSLLAAVADEVLAELGTDGTRGDWQEWLPAWADQLRTLLLAHRDAAELVASTGAIGLGRTDPSAAGRAVLVRAGFSPDVADATMQAFLHFVLGHVTEEQTQKQLLELGVLDSVDENRARRYFERGVDLLVAGTRALQ